MTRKPKRPRATPLGLRGIRTYSLHSRRSKVGVAEYARPHRPGGSFAQFLSSLPRQLAGVALPALVSEIVRARRLGKPILWGLGAHVIKVGLSPLLVDLMERGSVQG